jgi:putative Ca2+/H+ antiporter (TMEM165/GDT1 family)
MDWKLLGSVFTSLFLAELGDKTQLATIGFASRPGSSRWLVFLGSAAALVASSALCTWAGAWIGSAVSPRTISLAAGVVFVAIGALTIARAL